MRLDNNCTSLGAGTFLGVKANETLSGLFLDASGDVNVIGRCESSNFPTTTGAYDTTHNGRYDLFVTKMNASLDKIESSTFIGGSNEDMVNGILYTSGDILYFTGLTRSKSRRSCNPCQKRIDARPRNNALRSCGKVI